MPWQLSDKEQLAGDQSAGACREEGDEAEVLVVMEEGVRVPVLKL